GHLAVDGSSDALAPRFAKDSVECERGGALLCSGKESAGSDTDRLAVEEREPVAEPGPRSAKVLDRLRLDHDPAPDSLPTPGRGRAARRRERRRRQPPLPRTERRARL